MAAPLKIQAYHRGKKIYENTLNLPVTIGRTPQNNVVLELGFVSRTHCRIYEDHGKVYLEDLNSSNGVYIFDKKITKCEVTEDFDFRLGEIEVHVEFYSQVKKIPPPVVSQEIAYPTHHDRTAASHTKTAQMHHAFINRDFSQDLLGLHSELGTAKSKKMEAVVMWHDQVYEVMEFYPKEKIVVGKGAFANLHLPLPQEWTLASVDFDSTVCAIPPGRDVSLIQNGKRVAMGDLIANQQLKQKEIGYQFRMSSQEVIKIDLGAGLNVTLRYVPATKRLTRAKITEPEESFKQSIISSLILHAALAFIMVINTPKTENVPKIKNVPERFAKLLMRPKPTPPPPPPPEKKIVEKKPEPKRPKPEPKKVVQKMKPPKKIFKQPKILSKKNKFPMVVEHPMPKAPPPVKVENLGALGALGAISPNAKPNVVTNININPNAGGMKSAKINTGGIVGALPSANGKLMAGGNVGNVKTKGFGYGTGTGYGIQGLKGVAGSRGVRGAIVGQPKLAQTAKTEGLTRAQVMAVVQKYLGEVQHCYERNLLSNPSLAGRMEFEWDIAASGQVTDVRVKRSSVSGGDSLGECVKGVFASMQFPQAKNGATTTPNIGFPFGRL